MNDTSYRGNYNIPYAYYNLKSQKSYLLSKEKNNSSTIKMNK